MRIKHNPDEADMDEEVRNIEQTEPQFPIIAIRIFMTERSRLWQKSHNKTFTLIGPKSSKLWGHHDLSRLVTQAEHLDDYDKQQAHGILLSPLSSPFPNFLVLNAICVCICFTAFCR